MSQSVPRILVVDDDPDIRGVIREFLAPDGYDVRLAANGREAFCILEVVAMSGATYSPYLRAAELLGASATLSKPLNSSLLRLTLQQVLTVAP